jgi:hypothetical protein
MIVPLVKDRYIFGLLLLLADCAGRPPPCSAPSSCASRRACITGRCVPADWEPAPPKSQRVVVAASDLAVVSSRGENPSPPDAVAFGAASSGSVVLLLKFPTPWGNQARVLSAFLMLDPMPGAPPDAIPVEVAVARVLEPWSGASVTWGRQPQLSGVETTALARTGPPRPLRIDVTRLVQAWQRTPSRDRGIALLAKPADAVGAQYSTGAAGGMGPRLDVYLQ